MLKSVFFGSPEFAATILEKLSSYSKPICVVTPPLKAKGRGQIVEKNPVQLMAESKNIAVLNTDNINTPEFIEKLKALDADLFLVVAFGQLFKANVLALPKIACLNVHASLLPRWRGAAPIQYSLLNGDSKTGVSIQKMVLKLDAGDVLHSKEMPLKGSETTETLTQALSMLGGEALVEAIQKIESKKYSFTPQKESEVTFSPKIQKEDAKLDFNLPAIKLEQKIRALQPWPVAYGLFGKEKFKIYKAIVEQSQGDVGKITTDHKTYLKIQCGEGVLSLKEIQLENKKRLNIIDFLNAYRGNFPYTRVEL
jgi:methionyl-tRNA formyltransferase